MKTIPIKHSLQPPNRSRSSQPGLCSALQGRTEPSLPAPKVQLRVLSVLLLVRAQQLEARIHRGRWNSPRVPREDLHNHGLHIEHGVPPRWRGKECNRSLQRELSSHCHCSRVATSRLTSGADPQGGAPCPPPPPRTHSSHFGVTPSYP